MYIFYDYFVKYSFVRRDTMNKLQKAAHWVVSSIADDLRGNTISNVQLFVFYSWYPS